MSSPSSQNSHMYQHSAVQAHFHSICALTLSVQLYWPTIIHKFGIGWLDLVNTQVKYLRLGQRVHCTRKEGKVVILLPNCNE